MILRTESVEQVVDGHERARFIKEIVMTEGEQPLGMVRKRLPEPHAYRGVVMLVHGFGQNRYTWHNSHRSFVNYLARMGWDVFNIDLRGHGRSKRFGSSRPAGLEDYIREDLPACVEEALAQSGEKRLFLVGHSMGGLVSYLASGTKLRDRLRGIVSLGSPYVFGQGSALLFFLRTLARAVRWTGLLDSNPALPLAAVGRHLKRRQRWWDASFLPLPIRAWAPGTVESEVLDEFLAKGFDRSSIGVALDIFKGGNTGSFKSHDGMIDYSTSFEMRDDPILVIAGSEDGLAPPKSVKPAFDRSRSRDKTYRCFPLGHVDLVVGKEATRTVWPLIHTWLSRR